MRAVGIVRKVDELGRIVIPKELRNTMNITEGTPLEIFVNNAGEIVLRKYHPGCRFCGGMESLVSFSGEYVCQSCIDNLISQQVRKSS